MSGFALEAWLVVAQGGWWKPREILERLPSGVEVDDYHNRLVLMATRQRSLVSRGGRGNREYAVTPDCKVPMGLTVGAVNAALNGGAE